jgi:hypothetical protein
MPLPHAPHRGLRIAIARRQTRDRNGESPTTEFPTYDGEPATRPGRDPRDHDGDDQAIHLQTVQTLGA